MAGMMSIALSGLNAAQAGLTTTSHNIANANVDGYTRQQIVQGTQIPVFAGVGFFGQGTKVDTITRVYSQFLDAQVLATSSAKAQYDTYASEVNQVDSLLADETTGISPAMQDFFTAVDKVAASPSDTSARQALISSAQALATRFQSVNQRLDDIRGGVEGSIEATATNITNYAKEIAQLNHDILVAQAAGPEVPANDLLDERNRIVSQLNTEIKVTTQEQSDGTINVFIGTGQSLVMGTDSFAMTAVPAADDPSHLALNIGLSGGAAIELPESYITGGNLAGLLSFRADLDQTQNGLGRIATGIATTVNAQNKLGIDLNGLMGGNFFTPATTTVQGLPGTAAASSITATITSVKGLTTDDYLLSYDGTNYLLTQVSDGSTVYSGTTLPQATASSLVAAGTAVYGVTTTANATGVAEDYLMTYNGPGSYTIAKRSDPTAVVYNGGVPATVEGLQISLSAGAPTAGDTFVISPGVEGLSISGTMVAGDKFTIKPTRNGARDLEVAIGDPRLVAAGAPFTTSADRTNSGTGKISAGSVVGLNGIAATNPHIGNVTMTYGATSGPGGVPGFAITGATPASIAYDPVTEAAGKTFTLGSPAVSFAISGVPSSTDVFRLASNTDGISDSRNAVLLGKLQLSKVLEGGNTTFNTGYAQVVSEVGMQANSASVNAKAQEGLLAQATTSQQSLSGVNLDEEAANLIRYQQAYQASARALSIAQTIFDDILSLMR